MFAFLTVNVELVCRIFPVYFIAGVYDICPLFMAGASLNAVQYQSALTRGHHTKCFLHVRYGFAVTKNVCKLTKNMSHRDGRRVEGEGLRMRATRKVEFVKTRVD